MAVGMGIASRRISLELAQQLLESPRGCDIHRIRPDPLTESSLKFVSVDLVGKRGIRNRWSIEQHKPQFADHPVELRKPAFLELRLRQPYVTAAGSTTLLGHGLSSVVFGAQQASAVRT